MKSYSQKEIIQTKVLMDIHHNCLEIMEICFYAGSFYIIKVGHIAYPDNELENKIIVNITNFMDLLWVDF